MKLFSNDLTKLINLITQNQIKSIVLHGNNQGFLTTIIEQIVQKLNYRVTPYNSKKLSIETLSLLANSQNFFQQKELIKIPITGTTISKEMQEFLTQNMHYHLICFVADSSLPSSGIRKFFEGNNQLAIIGCYYDNEQTIAKMILQQCHKRSQKIDEDALFYLKTHLKGDHQIIKSELKKLFFYTYDQKFITKTDILACLSSDLIASGDEMCIFFAKKDYLRFCTEVQQLKQQNVNEILIIRALIRYFINIYIVALRMEDGEDLNSAIRSITPAIFYKYVEDFKQIMQQYNSNDASRIIHSLQLAEVSFKQNPNGFDLFAAIAL
ncbi:MAG: DNA polymerase III subunit delta [Rickettsiaceae bacterium]